VTILIRDVAGPVQLTFTHYTDLNLWRITAENRERRTDAQGRPYTTRTIRILRHNSIQILAPFINEILRFLTHKQRNIKIEMHTKC
jgi:hypothetical protein